MPVQPKIWTKRDIPTPAELAGFLGRVRAVQEAMPRLAGAPELPPDMDRLTFALANDIEAALLYAARALTSMEKSRVYSGEGFAGGF